MQIARAIPGSDALLFGRAVSFSLLYLVHVFTHAVATVLKVKWRNGECLVRKNAHPTKNAYQHCKVAILGDLVAARLSRNVGIGNL